jgi:hypothetical protein
MVRAKCISSSIFNFSLENAFNDPHFAGLPFGPFEKLFARNEIVWPLAFFEY